MTELGNWRRKEVCARRATPKLLGGNRSASKYTFSHYNFKILRKNLKNLRKKFCEFPPWALKNPAGL